MKKVIKIKESEVFGMITKIINEQSVGEIKVRASSDLGTHPNFDGLKTLLSQLKNNVQAALRGKIPYRIKSNENDGTVRPMRQGNTLMLEVTLIPSEEAKRDYFFDGAAGIYSYINTTSISLVEGKVRMAAMDKARASFIGSKPQELSPNHIWLSKFTGLNTLSPEKVYQLMLKFVCGPRPGGFYDVSDEESPSSSGEMVASATQTNTTNPVEPGKKVEISPEKKQVAGEEKSVDEDFNSSGDNALDDAHNVKEFIAKVKTDLEDMWKRGKNPIVTDITMAIAKGGDGGYSTKLNAKIEESTDGKAWVGIESRGSAGNNYVERADDQYNGGRYDNKGRPMIDKATGKQINKGQGEMKKDGSRNPCYGKSLVKCMQDHVDAGEVKTLGPIEDASIPFKQYFVNFTKPKTFPAR